MTEPSEQIDMQFEFYTLLKCAVAIFTLENLPLQKSDTLLDYNFSPWIKIESNILSRILELIKKMLPEGKSNRLFFKQYIDSKITTDYSKSKVLEEVLNQSTQEDSLILLGTTFSQIKIMAENIASIKNVNFNTFQSIGHFVRREVAFNKFFDPFEPPFFKPTTDKIYSKHINEIIRAIPDQHIKKITSAVMLEMFRILKYLAFTHEIKYKREEISRAIAIYCLINSESRDLNTFLHNEFLSYYSKKEEQESTFYELLESIAFQLKFELKKVFKSELLGIVNETKFRRVIARCENTTGILENFFKQSIETIAKYFEPTLKGEELFESYISKKQQSSKLLKNLLILNKLTLYTKERIVKSTKEEELKEVVKKFKNYLEYFEKYVIILFRLNDREEMEKLLCSFNNIDFSQIIRAHKSGFIQSLNLLSIFMDTLIPMVRRRNELRDFEWSEDIHSQIDELLTNSS